MRPAYSVLYSFKGRHHGDGADPIAGLIMVRGTLYGTTKEGGAHCKASGGCGTVFAITTSGAETVLHSFGGSPDGAGPYAGLIDVKGTLYGTTRRGGGCGGQHVCGTVFAITTSGAETVLHSFGGYGDGAYPYAGLINVKGTLYGTTLSGGPEAYGTAFSITTSGTETVLHGFSGLGSGDGAFPEAGLINVNGTLYGTTYEGGARTDNGTVFKVSTSGAGYTELYSFNYGTDGAYPVAGLVNVNGTLYGTTIQGGANCGGTGGCGTVFKITASGKETVLHSFGLGSGDGAYPAADLINVNGTLYGTTDQGGANARGTVFSITTSGTETVLYSFKGGSGDGAYPVARLLNVKGTLYGTSGAGGANGYGTVFSLSP
ncbi:MAG: choice-of-anchor tandem repeat GloVer-containing protein [Candidatus Cybelea sp.]